MSRLSCHSYAYLFLSFVGASTSGQANGLESLVLAQKVYLPVDEPAELDCTVNGTNLLPGQHITAWKHNGKWLTNRTRKINNTTIQLTFENVSSYDQGVYICGLFNFTSKGRNKLLRNVSILVGAKPTQPAEPNCDALGWLPLTTISWKISDSGIVSDVFLSHASETNFCLIVQDVLFRRIPHCRQVSADAQQAFNCSVTEYVKKTFSGNLPRKILCVSIRAQNHFGETFSAVKTWDIEEFSRCTKPETFQVVNGQEEINVSWRYPRQVDHTIYQSLFYQLSLHTIPGNAEHHEESKIFEENWHANATYHGQFTDLQCNTRYVLRVACIFSYAHKDSIWGEEASLIASTVEKAPSQPIDVLLYARDIQGLKITWKLPDNRTWCGIPLIAICYWPITSPKADAVIQCRNLSVSALDITLQGLDRYTTYNFTVTLCNSRGCANPVMMYTTEDLTEYTTSQTKKETNVPTLTIVLTLVSVILFIPLTVAVLVWKYPRSKPRRKRLHDEFANVKPNAPEITPDAVSHSTYDIINTHGQNNITS